MNNYNNSLEDNSSIHTTPDCFLPVGHGIALMIVNSLAAVVGTFGNFLVCAAVLYVNPRLRSCSNYLLVSLAIADLIVTMVAEPLFVAIIGKRALAGDCVRNSVELASAVSSQLSCSASVMHLAAISVDRFTAVIFPLRHGRIMKNYGLKMMLIVVWVLAIVFASFRVLFQEETYYLVLVSFVVSYSLIIGCYVSIMVFLVKEKKRKDFLRAKPSSVVVKSKVERRVAVTFAIAIGVFTASWLPVIVVFYTSGESLVKMHGTEYILTTLALSNSAVNFLIYSARIRDFRDAFALICRKILRCV